jgi:outer membrane protein assembly factor BamD
VVIIHSIQKQYILGLFVLLVLSTSLSACGKKAGFSLSNAQQQNLSQCEIYFQKNKVERAIKCFEAYKSQHYSTKKGIYADLMIAESYFKGKDYLLAGEAYTLFISAYPYHEKVPYAYYKAGLSFFNQAPKTIDRDQSVVDDAIKSLEAVLKYYSQTPYAPLAKVVYQQARLRKAQRSYYVGRYYFKTHEYLAAAPRFQSIITDYANLGLDEKSFYYLIQSLRNTHQKELADKYYSLFAQYYPESQLVKRLD